MNLMASAWYPEFFEPLVGSPQAVNRFRDVLIQGMRACSPQGDPYDSLLAGVEHEVQNFTTRQLAASPAVEERKEWEKVDQNIKAGIGVAIVMLRAESLSYELNARAPPAACKRGTEHQKSFGTRFKSGHDG
jgi:hypothetical protein